MKRVAIVHFNPIEAYPPILNLLDYFFTHANDWQVDVYTQAAHNGALYKAGGNNIHIHRFSVLNPSAGLLQRYAAYRRYYTTTFWYLQANPPGAILYYETMSAWPVYWFYRKYPASTIPLLIHYHEYVEPAEYQRAPWMIRWQHRLEKKLYPRAAWISHTNAERMSLFQQDEHLQPGSRFHVLPNYPSKAWQRNKDTTRHLPVRVVYVGAISMDSSLLAVFASWVQQQNGEVLFDIYSQQEAEDVKQYLAALQSPYISWKGFIPYAELPTTLATYHAGVILYRGNSKNYVYNAPNKLFEYLACGLDVWYPKEVIGIREYMLRRKAVHPKILELDFAASGKWNLGDMINNEGLTYEPSSFFYEKTYEEFERELERITEVLAN